MGFERDIRTSRDLARKKAYSLHFDMEVFSHCVDLLGLEGCTDTLREFGLTGPAGREIRFDYWRNSTKSWEEYNLTDAFHASPGQCYILRTRGVRVDQRRFNELLVQLAEFEKYAGGGCLEDPEIITWHEVGFN